MGLPRSAHRRLPPGGQPLVPGGTGGDAHHGSSGGAARRDPRTALERAKLLLDTAEDHLQDEGAANQLLGWDLYDLLSSDDVLPLLVEELKWDDRLARQLFQSAYVDRPQEAILNACGRLGETELQRKLLDLLACSPFPHDEIELETDGE